MTTAQTQYNYTDSFNRITMSMEEWGGIDDINGESGVSESTRESSEHAAAQAQARAQALQALQKQEQQARKQEASLIHILRQLLESKQHRDIANIIVKLLEQNIPVQIILAILSLIFPELQHPETIKPHTVLTLSGPSLMEVQRASDEQGETFDAERLPTKAKQELNQWIKHIITASLPAAHGILHHAYIGERVNSTLIRLMMVTLERYLVQYSIRSHQQRMGEFATFALQGIMKQIATRSKTERLQQGNSTPFTTS